MSASLREMKQVAREQLVGDHPWLAGDSELEGMLDDAFGDDEVR